MYVPSTQIFIDITVGSWGYEAACLDQC